MASAETALFTLHSLRRCPGTFRTPLSRCTWQASAASMRAAACSVRRAAAERAQSARAFEARDFITAHTCTQLAVRCAHTAALLLLSPRLQSLQCGVQARCYVHAVLSSPLYLLPQLTSLDLC